MLSARLQSICIGRAGNKLTCKRCEDIHTAQKAGKTHEPCKCDCHNDYGTTLTSPITAGTILFNTQTTGDNTVWQFSDTGSATTNLAGNSAIDCSGNMLKITTSFDCNGDECNCQE